MNILRAKINKSNNTLKFEILNEKMKKHSQLILVMKVYKKKI